MVVVVLSIILVYEFTIGKKISQFGGKVEEIKKAVKKERYLSKEDAKLIGQFITKIQNEINEAGN